MSTPYEWRIDAIERKANRACDMLWKITAHDGYVDSLQCAVRELGSRIDGLRTELESARDKIERLEREIEKIKPSVT